MGKDSSGTIHLAFGHSGQILKIRDCPGDSGTVGAYETIHVLELLLTAIRVPRVQ